ncbi:TolC family protein [Pseudorhodoplanes sinuspersici]|uniref:Copper resistance protein n=1 Tax=Pseudorhodoplanes sinuspersici TaxID=1235591 RepID=A0A1W6ZUQ9_9HYPH|nr:TolC family protein [Pseudorhodoplanes sinuspersici]ARQ01060.1 copper resistance protein [Pseudorhodoplanes sinuspersici]RKE72704.1 outer membrane protein TolC [Pseudorhodoplanes sinuspersici]
MKTIATIMRASLLAATLVLAGCASFSADSGMGAVQGLAGAPIGKEVIAIRSEEDALAARSLIDTLLAKPLTADSAVQIALLNNRDLQAAYNQLGISEAQMVQASLPPNPTFSIERIAGAGSVEIEARAIAGILSLLTLPARAQIAADRFRQAQLQAADTTLRVATDARRAYFRAVAARSLAGFLVQSQSAAEAATQLSRELGESGTMTKLDQARNQVFFAELTAQLAQARQLASTERERLIRTMGLWGPDTEFRLPASLPRLPGRPSAQPDIEREAVARRLDLQIARMEVLALARSADLTNATRLISVLELAGIRKKVTSDEGTERERGFELELQIPIFDLGTTRVRQAEETYMQAVNRLTAKAVNIRSEAREAYGTYRAAYDIARHYQREVLPLRKIISDETLLRYNAMQIDVFTLLTEARQRIASTTSAIEAERAFWLAAANLGAAVLGGGAAAAEGATPGATMAAAEAGGGH